MTSTWTADDVVTLRRMHHWTQEDLAAVSGYSTKTIVAFETDRRTIQKRHEILFGFLQRFGPLCDG
jgi:transcriptional regulator with XRE-family HTH domain